VARLAAAAFFSVAFAASALAAGPWDGTYVYEQGLGKGAGGISLFVTHTLTIDGPQCRLVAEGYQTDEHVRCKATATGDRLEVAFVSFKDGSTLNRFGVREYTANQPLFTLTRQGDAIATTWQGYNRNDVDTTGVPTFRKLPNRGRQ
jgi:alpha-acetolactate decarboxylase